MESLVFGEDLSFCQRGIIDRHILILAFGKNHFITPLIDQEVPVSFSVLLRTLLIQNFETKEFMEACCLFSCQSGHCMFLSCTETVK